MLTGTHGLVRPWTAPRAAPPAVLRELHGTLLAALRERAVAGERDAEREDEGRAKVRARGALHWLTSAFH